ncbi:hypothetical protein [Bradyrhizobium sp. SZCCHNS2096]|uniref:hypothetical protein n=1 Tax=Bradyrhizobium sp. SZCCHNS2096 TaxID=3057309 RepID=UPI00291654C6|nr:hypothetical protein [Bradyrhizobium sp. SZCCHNS2096]
MTVEGKYPELNHKDLLVFVPLLTSTIAMCWQIGKFVPARLFFFAFSLSDHLVAAAAAIPITLFLVSYSTIGNFLLLKFGTPNPTARRLIVMFLISGPPAVIGGLGLAWLFGYVVTGAVVIPALAWTISFAFLNIATRSLRLTLVSPLGVAFIFGSAAIISLTAAWASSVAALRRSELGTTPLATITTKKSGGYVGLVIMMGERGLLTYGPAQGSFRFTRADEIISIELPAER